MNESAFTAGEVCAWHESQRNASLLTLFLSTRAGVTRLDAVKGMFSLFADRSIAYEYHHVVGLTLFNSTVQRVCPLTDAFESFLKDHVLTAKASGETALWDALEAARTELNWFCAAFPKCRKRILCLTDGDDTYSARTTAAAVCQSLQKDDVVVDSILLMTGNRQLKAISVATGGCCFNPATYEVTEVRIVCMPLL